MSQLLRIAARVFNTPLLVLPSTALTIATLLSSRSGLELEGEDLRALVEAQGPQASRFVGSRKGPDGERRPYAMQDGTAIVTVDGELVNRGAWLGTSSGLVSYEGITAQLSAGRSDPAVTSGIIDLNSPGGEAVGAMEAAAAARAFAAEKPLIAVVNGMAASAAYAIASGASEIVTAPSGISGSIGVVMLHVDQSQKLAKAGVSPTLIFAGAHKVDGHSLGPLPDAVRDDMQAEVDRFYGLFVDTVAAGRPNLDADAIRATEARTFIGQAAVDVGLADQVGTFDDALASLKSRAPRSSSPTPTPPRGTLMSEDTKPTVDAATERKTGATSERDRIKAITTCEEAKGREGLAAHFAYETDMSAEAAKKALAASPKADAALEGMRAHGGPNLGADGGKAPGAETEAKIPAASEVYGKRRETSLAAYRR